MSNQSQPNTSTESENSVNPSSSGLIPLPPQQPSSPVALLTDGLPTWFSDDGVTGVLTTIDVSTNDGKLAVMEAKLAPGTPLSDVVGRPFLLENILAFPVKIQRDEGEIIDSVRIHLVTPEGTVYTTCSVGVRDSVRLIFSLYGMKPFTPPIRVVCNKHKAKKAGHFLVLNVLRSDADVPKEPRKTK